VQRSEGGSFVIDSSFCHSSFLFNRLPDFTSSAKIGITEPLALCWTAD